MQLKRIYESQISEDKAAKLRRKGCLDLKREGEEKIILSFRNLATHERVWSRLSREKSLYLAAAATGRSVSVSFFCCAFCCFLYHAARPAAGVPTSQQTQLPPYPTTRPPSCQPTLLTNQQIRKSTELPARPLAHLPTFSPIRQPTHLPPPTAKCTCGKPGSRPRRGVGRRFMLRAGYSRAVFSPDGNRLKPFLVNLYSRPFVVGNFG